MPGLIHNHQESSPEIDRGPLRDLLLNSLEPDTVQWNAQVKQMQTQGDGWILEFTSGDRVYANLLIVTSTRWTYPARPLYYNGLQQCSRNGVACGGH